MLYDSDDDDGGGCGGGDLCRRGDGGAVLPAVRRLVGGGQPAEAPATVRRRRGRPARLRRGWPRRPAHARRRSGVRHVLAHLVHRHGHEHTPTRSRSEPHTYTYTLCPQKRPPFYFSNNPVKNWPILMLFGVGIPEKI